MALRRERQVPTIYFGRPGQLLSLPWPKSGIDKPYERQTFDFLTGSGLHQVSSLSAGSRAFTISWDVLHVDTFNKLAQYRIGANGPGPWALIDPSDPNLLPPNVGSATGVFNNATQIVTTGGTGGTGGSNNLPAFIHRSNGWRSMRWRFLSAPIDATPAFGVLPMFRNWFGQPVAPNLPYAFSSWMRVDGTVETSATVAMRMRWLDSAGATISEVTSGDLAVTSTWQRLSVTGTAPSNAAYVEPRWVAVGSSLVLNGIIYIDEPILEQDTVVNDWAPSSGIRPVEIVGLGEGVPFEARFRTGVSLTLRELAR
jgi:hypothetical protein